MQFNIYLSFDGKCEEAFKYYQKIFGGEITAMFPYEGSPAMGNIPADWGKKIMHACLNKDGRKLMGGDAPPGCYKPTQGICAQVEIPDVEEAKRVFAALAKDGNITMPGEPTFWAAYFGMAIDKFGTPWMVNCPLAEPYTGKTK